jgi:hypothetical protein
VDKVGTIRREQAVVTIAGRLAEIRTWYQLNISLECQSYTSEHIWDQYGNWKRSDVAIYSDMSVAVSPFCLASALLSSDVDVKSVYEPQWVRATKFVTVF